MGTNVILTGTLRRPDAGSIPAVSTKKKKYRPPKVTMWDHLSEAEKDILRDIRKSLQNNQ